MQASSRLRQKNKRIAPVIMSCLTNRLLCKIECIEAAKLSPSLLKHNSRVVCALFLYLDRKFWQIPSFFFLTQTVEVRQSLNEFYLILWLWETIQSASLLSGISRPPFLNFVHSTRQNHIVQMYKSWDNTHAFAFECRNQATQSSDVFL